METPEEWPLPEGVPEAIAAYMRAHRAVEIAERRSIVRWAAIFCDCSPWYVRGEGPPQQGCPVHGGVMLFPGGGYL